MSQLGVMLQESVRGEREARTILCFLREQMDVADEERGIRKRTLKERLGLKGMGCCGATWGFRPTTMRVRDDDDEIEELQQQELERENHHSDPTGNNPVGPICSHPDPPGPIMNLAAALAAERQLRASNDNERETTSEETTGSRTRGSTAPGTPRRVSLMTLLEETDGRDARTEQNGGGGGVGSDSVCCVCMGRKKGAAFIPCGHAFCRVCSRELWLNRGACPLCNRPIIEILDIF